MRRAVERAATRTGWLSSRHSFSFGEHYDPANVGHGRLMVNNDDVVTAGAGYDDHPHRDAEIVTWVLSGSLVHEDSFGHRGIVYPGLGQRMSAGSGIVHAERNDAFRLDASRPAEPVRFVQMWVRPDEAGTPPSYAQRELDLSDLGRDWVPVASGSHSDAGVTLGARDATFWVTQLADGANRWLPEGPYVHVYIAVGAVELEAQGRLSEGDSVRLAGAGPLRVTGRGALAEVLVWVTGP